MPSVHVHVVASVTGHLPAGHRGGRLRCGLLQNGGRRRQRCRGSLRIRRMVGRNRRGSVCCASARADHQRDDRKAVLHSPQRSSPGGSGCALGGLNPRAMRRPETPQRHSRSSTRQRTVSSFLQPGGCASDLQSCSRLLRIRLPQRPASMLRRRLASARVELDPVARTLALTRTQTSSLRYRSARRGSLTRTCTALAPRAERPAQSPTTVGRSNEDRTEGQMRAQPWERRAPSIVCAFADSGPGEALVHGHAGRCRCHGMPGVQRNRCDRRTDRPLQRRERRERRQWAAARRRLLVSRLIGWRWARVVGTRRLRDRRVRDASVIR